MIRLIQRRLIIPRGDTGTFTVPALSPGQSDSVGVFTIFDPITKTRVFQKQVELQDGVFNIEFDHGDTVNLQAGDYLWDIKFYVNPIIENGKVIDGTEIDSYYAAFQTPKCEIRETGDDFMVIDGQPAKIEDLNIILAATSAANAAKIAATEQAEIAAEKASEAAERLAQMIAAIPTKVSELENDSGYLQEETDPTVPAWAKARTKPSYTPQEVGALPSDTFIPSKVSDLTDDSGHYIKPANGIPASDLEETYLTQHQDISMKANSADLAAVATSGSYNDLEDKPTIPEVPVQDVQVNGVSVLQDGVANVPIASVSQLGAVRVDPTYGITRLSSGKLQQIPATSYFIKNASNGTNPAKYNPITPEHQHESVFYGLAKAAGDTTQSESDNAVGAYTDSAKTAIQQMLDVPSTAAIPTQVSELENDAGYLTSFTETDPTVPSWAKEPTKPIYTAAEVNAVNKTGDTMTGALTLPYINQSYRNALRFATNADAHEMGINARYDENYDYGYFTVSSELKSGFTKDAIIRGVKNPRYSNDAANKEYVDNKISTAIGNINSFDMAVVQALPTEDISTHTIYLVPKTGETNDVYDEYVYINSAWEMVGNTQVDLSNYVQKTDYATSSDAGVVKVGSDYGIQILSDGEIRTNPATDSNIKLSNASNAPIVPQKQHQSVFYGLARAAGDSTQSTSSNAIGIYTDEAKAAIQQMLDVPSTNDIPIEAGTGFGSVQTKPFEVDRLSFTQQATGLGSFAEGIQTEAQGEGAHAEGAATIASGQYSHAEGHLTSAVGIKSHAEGIGTTASGEGSHVEGANNIASGQYSHAEGGHVTSARGNKAIGFASHVEGTRNTANGSYSHVEGYWNTGNATYVHIGGKFSVEDTYDSWSEWTANTEYAVKDKVKVTTVIDNETTILGYICIVANSDAEFTDNNWSLARQMNFAEIIGNGAANTNRSNAYALDWDGNGHYMGNIYVGANADSTGGTKVLCEADFATDLDIQNIINGGAGA